MFSFLPPSQTPSKRVVTRKERVLNEIYWEQEKKYLFSYLYFIGWLFVLCFILSSLLWNDKEVVPTAEAQEQVIVSEKQAVSSQISHKEIKGDKYTIKVGLWGSRKNIPVLTSVTVRARASEWFIANNVYDEDISLWVDMGEKYKIDYIFPICIAWADSHLWKALKSKNNIGNVWNNDRGDTKDFETREKGIEAMFSQLAYGTYLKWHTIIGTLSGEGRKIMGIETCTQNGITNKKCYASSEVVWSTNVTNCMSVLHNKQVDVWTEFRI